MTPGGQRTGRGFTLLELVVVIAVIGILVAAVTPAVMQQLIGDRVDGTRAEMEAVVTAMVGDPSKSQFGFVGDIGRLPNSLAELIAKGGLPNYTTNTVRNIGMGWRGPYINAGTSSTDYQTDAFGRAYVLSAGQIRSAGSDGVLNNADDILYPPTAPEIAGDAQITVKTMQGNKVVVDPNTHRVEIYYADDGDEDSLTDNNGPFSFTNLPIGLHAVRVVRKNNGNVVAEDTITVRPNATTAAELWF
jgi:general secretion pathway protein G